jgi:hypothetical protein
LLAINVFPTIFVKQFRVCLVLIRKLPEIDVKVLELVLKCIKSKLNHAISKLATKVGNLELRNQHAKCTLSQTWQNDWTTTQIGIKTGFSKYEGRNALQ